MERRNTNYINAHTCVYGPFLLSGEFSLLPFSSSARTRNKILRVKGIRNRLCVKKALERSCNDKKKITLEQNMFTGSCVNTNNENKHFE